MKRSSSSSKKPQSRTKAYIKSYNFIGTVLGAVFVYLGFLPTLLPRGWVLQGVMSGILFAIGYGIGLIISHFYRKFNFNEPDKRTKVTVKKYVYVTLAALYVVALFLGFNWQQEVRTLVSEPPAYEFSVVGTTLVAVLLAMLIMWISRAIRSLFHWLGRMIDKFIPRAVAYVAAWVLTVALVAGIVNGVIFSNLINVLNESFGVKNGTTDSGVVQPTDSHLSGGNGSLIAWDTLGRQGRNFVDEAEKTQDLTKFNSAPAMQPVRIYSGLESADNTKARAELAAQDLKRAGGLDRKIVVVVTTTGTGWVDEQGVAPVEYMYNGDSAIVAMQYSFLPSWLSFLVDQTKAKDAGRELYNAVYAEVLDMPADKRPKVVVFGESLGSFGGESAFANESAFRATSDGAVWAGPPNFNILRKTATSNRDAGSPEILPVYQNGKTVRFAARANDFKNPATPWGSPKAVYLENPSDPIVWWSPNLLFTKPDWLKEPRGFDVSSKVHWIPIVTFWGVTADMAFSTGVPDGHGHKYGTMPTDAWSYVAPSEGWTADKTQALKQLLTY